MATVNPPIRVDLPGWIEEHVDWTRRYAGDEEKMRFAIELARQNVLHATGGPFGAAIIAQATGEVVAVGVNSVVRLNNCTLHGEMVAIMMAQARLESFTLRGAPGGAYELITSCEPCAMCLGATLWSGVTRLVFAATREDATRLSFDEGPVFPESYAYLEQRGITIERGRLRDEANAVFDLYLERGGPIYNG